MVSHLPPTLSHETCDHIKTSLSHSLTPSSSVVTLYNNRLTQLVVETLTTTKEDLFPLMRPHILHTLGARLRTHVRILRKVLRVNIRVNAPHYNSIIKEETAKLILAREA
ncbi:hypothetical protein T484DRAFT_1743085 [Baffinella frigidus]|nr:hypothetical protein T484DRAFT_1743085 [Cryptophyta sp. CCMP2293]